MRFVPRFSRVLHRRISKPAAGRHGPPVGIGKVSICENRPESWSRFRTGTVQSVEPVPTLVPASATTVASRPNHRRFGQPLLGKLPSAGQACPRVLGRGPALGKGVSNTTEAKWLACTDPARMLDFLGYKASDRKLRLFAAACCRHILRLLKNERVEKAVMRSEDIAEGKAQSEKLQAVLAELQTEVKTGPGTGTEYVGMMAVMVTSSAPLRSSLFKAGLLNIAGVRPWHIVPDAVGREEDYRPILG
jgi:hypothetical protein